MDTIIIAEAGVNHNGNIELAKKLVDVAAAAGANYVKFQTFKAKNLASKSAEKADYQKQTTDAVESQLEMLQKLELSEENHYELITYCRTKNIAFLSTPFDLESIDLLQKLGIKLGKIPSGEITNLPYLRKMAQSFDQLILSTGMAEMQEVEEAVKVIADMGFPKEKLIILHCTTEYPTPFSEVNLLAMKEMALQLGIKTGYSDHTPGIEVSVAAVALGAVLIEKHFTLDRSMKGPDHKASLEPSELISMVKAIRNIEKALGNGIKIPSPSELKNKFIARKSIVAVRNLDIGHVLTPNDLTTKRPGTGISPMQFDIVIGKKLVMSIAADEVLTINHLGE